MSDNTKYEDIHYIEPQDGEKRIKYLIRVMGVPYWEEGAIPEELRDAEMKHLADTVWSEKLSKWVSERNDV